MPGPGEVIIRFRFFNETEEMAEVEAWAGASAQTTAPVAHIPVVPPYQEPESLGQFDPVLDPRFASVSIKLDGTPLGTFSVGGQPPVYDDITFVYVRLSYDYVGEQGEVVLVAENDSGAEVDTRSYPL